MKHRCPRCQEQKEITHVVISTLLLELACKDCAAEAERWAGFDEDLRAVPLETLVAA